MSNPRPSRKPFIITGVLAVYAIVMAVWNIDTLTVHHDYFRFFGSLAAEAVILCALFFFLRRREALRREREQDMKK